MNREAGHDSLQRRRIQQADLNRVTFGFHDKLRGESSRRTKAVESAMVIRPLGITEVGSATVERVGGHRLPHGIGKVRAGINHHCLAAGPCEIEAKLIVPHAEAAVAGLHPWQPERNWNTGVGGEYTPTRGARQVIGRHIAGRKNIRISGGGVSREINSRQAGFQKRIVSNNGILHGS